MFDGSKCFIVIQHLSVIGGKMLQKANFISDSMLWNLAQQFTNNCQLRTLGQKLQKLDNSKIDTSITNYGHDINAAAYDVLRKWRVSQDNDTVAYKDICEALK